MRFYNPKIQTVILTGYDCAGGGLQFRMPVAVKLMQDVGRNPRYTLHVGKKHLILRLLDKGEEYEVS